MCSSFNEAYSSARSSYSDDQWDTLGVRTQTAAIYVEMRRLDAEAMRTARPDTTAPGDMPTGGAH
jgi:hypothetical protein